MTLRVKQVHNKKTRIASKNTVIKLKRKSINYIEVK